MAIIAAILLVVSVLYTPDACTVSAATVSVSVTESGSWDDGTTTFNMFNGTITNNTASAISNWKVTLPFASGASVNQGWCGTCSMSNGTLTVTPYDSNGTIPAGSSTSFGFIIENAGSYDVSSAVLSYDGSSASVTVSPSPSAAVSASPSPSTQASPTPSASASAAPAPSTTSSSSSSAAAVSASTSFTSSTVGSVELTSIPTVKYKTKDLKTSYDSAEIITFTSNAVSYNGSNATVNGSTITITTGGSYVVSGTCTDGQIVVNTEDFVQLILNSANLTSKTSAPIYVQNADKVVVTLAAGSTNTLSDTSSFTYTDAAEEEPNATVFSKDDLSFNGTGSLTVNSNFNNAIQCKDKLKFTQGNYTINSIADGIQGKDCVGICGGTFTIKTTGDGIKSTNDDDLTVGFVEITGGNITIDATKDGIQAESYIDIQGGTTTAAAGDDGLHADNNLTVDSGSVKLTASYEGYEAANIYVNGGDNNITASDDGINGSGSGAYVAINGGTLIVDASGDGLDCNGNMVMTGGVALVSGPTNGGNGALDYDGSFNISGGILVAAGSSGMAMNISSTSSQPGMLVTYSGSQVAKSVIILRDSQGKDLVAFNPAKTYQTVCISAPDMTVGAAYSLYTGATSVSTMKSLSADEYTLGSLIQSVTLTSIATGGGSDMGGGGFRPDNRPW